MAFSGFIVTFHELPLSKKKSLTEIISNNGGTISYILGKTTTHLITTAAELKANSYKVQKCKPLNITVVTEKWVEDSLKKYEKEKAQNKQDNNNNNNNNNKALVSKQKPIPGIPNTSFFSGFGLPAGVSPTVTLALPSTGPSSGNFQVALFGLNFDASPNFVVRIQSEQNNIVNATNYEFHSSTSLVCHIPNCVMEVGQMMILASNDGRNFGVGVPFTLTDPLCNQRNGGMNDMNSERTMTIIRSQLDNVRRAVLNIQRMELELSNQLMTLGGPNAYIDYEQQFYDRSVPQIAESDIPKAIDENVLKPKRLLDRELRLFISSTFKDLQLERNLIIRKVVPQIKRICVERDIIFSYVDLRWGITEAQSSQSTQILMCLRELQRSNLFIGILGERYGQFIPAETGAPLSSSERQEKESLLKAFQMAAKEFPWVDHYRDRSITEIEMRYILAANDLGTQLIPSWFFLRDPYYFEDVPQNERALYMSENAEAAKRSTQLKEDILQSEFPSFQYRRPANVCEIILENLKENIDQQFPEDNEIPEFDKERFRHDVVQHHLTRLYLHNEEYYHELDRHVSSSSETPIVIYGESGIGKSALIANWAVSHRAHHPEDVVIEHYIGSSSNSTHHIKTLLRIMKEMRRELEIDPSNQSLYNIDFDENLELDRVLVEFPVWIERVMSLPKQRRVILFIDGINKFASEGAGDLIWLPRTFPTNLRVILSSTTGQNHHYLCNKVLNKRQVPNLQIQPLSFAVRKQLCRKYLSELRGKNLTEAQEVIIAECNQTSNPRFLLTLLDDICVTAIHDDLSNRIQRVVQISRISDLYELILQRIELDYDSQKKGHIKTFLCLIWASRKGLMLSSEVIPLITSHYKGSITEDDFGALYMLIDEFLTNSGGLLSFSNDDIRTAVERYYLKDSHIKKQYHRELALFFEELKKHDLSTARILDELPYQLEKSDEFERLFALLCDIPMIDLLYSPNYKFEFTQYWRTIESLTPHRVVDEYAKLLKNAQFPPNIARSDLVYKVGQFFQEMSKYQGAEEMYKFAKALYENSSSTLEVAKVCFALGDLYFTQTKWDLAESYFLEALRANEKEAPESFESVQTMERLGTLYTNTNMIVKAKETLERALIICESRFGSENDLTANVIYALGCIYFIEAKSGLGGLDQEKAETWLRRSLEIKERLLGDWHPEVSRVLNRLGSIYLELVQFNDAEACFLEALRIREEKLGVNHSRCLQSHKLLISCYEMQEKFSDAIEHAIKALEICTVLFGEFTAQSANIYLRLGTLYWENNQKNEGIEALEKAIEIFTKCFGSDNRMTVEAKTTLKQLTVPPPPPPPIFVPPPPPVIIQPKIIAPLVSIIARPSGGAPPLPPPPPPPPKAAQRVQVKILPTTDDLQEGIQKINLKKQEYNCDRSDARKQYANMSGLNKRKLILKKERAK